MSYLLADNIGTPIRFWLKEEKSKLIIYTHK